MIVRMTSVLFRLNFVFTVTVSASKLKAPFHASQLAEND